jgi:ATP-dependent RNA helicase RhlE
MSFENLNLIKPIQSALVNEGYTIPTPIQQQAIPLIMERKDILGCAQTGTGKTAAFAIPILQILSEDIPIESNGTAQGSEKQSHHSSKKTIRSLIITPTRELAVQIGDSFSAYGKYTKIKNLVIYGGVSQRFQTDKLKRGVDVLIATPGRLLDLINQNYITLKHVKIFVLDEADRMLDMGFIDDVKRIMEKLPARKQSLFFSATMPPEIIKFSNTILSNPVKIEVTPESKTVEAIKQGVYFVAKSNKKRLLVHILKNEKIPSALVFTRTKRDADYVTQFLNNAKIQADAIHGNKSQNARQRALNNFKSNRTRVLVATDIASRGIDIEKLSHVFNFDIPDFSETYIHRIGRTGRAGLSGTALSFCDNEERIFLKDINKLIRIPIPVINDHPFKTIDQNLIEFPHTKSTSFRSSRRSRYRNTRSKW